MHIALHMTFAASRKEPLAEALARIRDAFAAAGLVPDLGFTLADAPLGGGTSIVDRAVKRFPDLAAFVTDEAPAPMLPAQRRLTNRAGPGTGLPAPMEALAAIAAGVPRSFPFHAIVLAFAHPDFGGSLPMAAPVGVLKGGVTLSDSWWVSGRSRGLEALVLTEGEPGKKTLPPLPGPAAAVLGAFGKPRKTVQTPLPGAEAEPSRPEAAEKVQAILRGHAAGLGDIIARAGLPHALPDAQAARAATPLGTTAGPLKPVLDEVFGPLGYSCKGGSGVFTLRRRTAANTTIELSLDVGTWSHSYTGSYALRGLGFGGVLPLVPTAAGEWRMQYPIGDAVQWRRIVENIAALAAEYDRCVLPEVEAAAGPSPAWFNP